MVGWRGGGTNPHAERGERLPARGDRVSPSPQAATEPSADASHGQQRLASVRRVHADGPKKGAVAVPADAFQNHSLIFSLRH